MADQDSGQEPTRRQQRQRAANIMTATRRGLTLGVIGIMGITAMLTSRNNSNPGQQQSPNAMTTPDLSGFKGLSAEDQKVVEWHIAEMRKSDVTGRFKEFSDDRLKELFSQNPETLEEARAMYERVHEKPVDSAAGKGR